jgi:hypothetical protein
MNIGSLNARTLKADWRLKEAVTLMADLKIDILCVIETRRRENTDTTEGGFVLKSHPANSAGVGGIGFIFSPKAWPHVLDLRLGARVSTAAVQLKDRRLVLATAYSPTSPNTETNPAETDAFYASLISLCNDTPRRDLLLIAGDFNAPLDCDGVLVTAPALGCENTNSEKLRAFALGNDIFLANGKLRQKPSRTATFYGPNKRVSRLDWIMARTHQRQAVKQIRTIRLTSLRSDHSLLIASLCFKWPHKRKARPRPLWSALQNSEIAGRFLREVSQHFIETADDLELAIKSASHLLPLSQGRSSPGEWRNNPEIRDLRRTLQSACNKHGINSEASALAESKLAEAHKTAVESYVNDLSAQLDQANGAGRSKEAWAIINRATGRKDRHRTILGAASLEDRLQKAAEYYHSLMNRAPANPQELRPEYSSSQPENYSTLRFTHKDLRQALKNTRLDSSPGPDEIPSRALQVTARHVLTVINNHSAINGGRSPETWRQSVIVSIPKKGTSTSLENQRGISLMCSAAKLSNRMLLNRLRPAIIERLSPLQAGFLPQRNTTQQLAAIRVVIDDCRKFKRNISIAFVDFKKAFDSISRAAIPQCLRDHGVPTMLIEAVMDLYTNTSARTRIDNDLSESFTTTSGVLQGDTLAPFLFVVVLDSVLRDAQLTGYTLRPRRSTRYPEIRLPFLAFADDVALLNNTSNDLQSALNRVYTSAMKVGLEINASKTEVLHIGEQNLSPFLLPSGERISVTNNFTYLGGKVANPTSAVSSRKATAWTAAGKLSRLFHSSASDASKVRLFRAAVEPVLFYGLEAVAMTETRARGLAQAHRALARFALGVHFPDVMKTEDLLRKGIPDADTLLMLKKQNLLKRTSPNAALPTVLLNPPTEGQRRGMSRLVTLRDTFSFS